MTASISVITLVNKTVENNAVQRERRYKEVASPFNFAKNAFTVYWIYEAKFIKGTKYENTYYRRSWNRKNISC